MALNRAPFNALVDDDGSGSVGTPWNKQAIKDVILDPVDAAFGVWTTYAVQWTTTATAPSVGNGALVGSYQLLSGKTLLLQIKLTFGTTTTAGTGAFVFSLPFPAVNIAQPVMCVVLDADFGTRLAVATMYGGGTQLVPYAANAPNGINNSLPMVWTTSDILEINGTLRLP